MEAFLLGDRGPEVFYEVQDQVLMNLEEKLFPAFLVSDVYHEMLLAIEKGGESDVSEGMPNSVQLLKLFFCIYVTNVFRLLLLPAYSHLY